MLNLKDIGQGLIRHKLMGKPFAEMDKEEITKMVEIIISSFDEDMPATGWEKPRIEDGALIIPPSAHPDYHWWKYGKKSLEEILGEINAPQEVWSRYVQKIDDPPF